jgi:RNA polymerase sigma factor (sigma-70 family)
MSIYTPEQIEHMVHDNMGLVVYLAKSLRPPNITEFDEYVQLGRIGLWKAIKKFDPSKKTKLSTIAYDYIRWEIIRYIGKQKKQQQLMENPLLISYTQQNDKRKTALTLPPELPELLPTNLTPSELQTVQMRNEGYTFEEIGKELGGYTRGWANKLFKSAIEKIKNAN